MQVGGFNPSEKYEFVSWDDYSQIHGKTKFMFQTTSQKFTWESYSGDCIEWTAKTSLVIYTFQ
jgi:hypothetical protein